MVEGARQGRSFDALLAAVERFAPTRRLGWAFLLAWVFCAFYTDAAAAIPAADVAASAYGAGW